MDLDLSWDSDSDFWIDYGKKLGVVHLLHVPINTTRHN